MERSSKGGEVVTVEDSPRRITADSTISEILERYPEAGPILLQHGRMFKAEKGRLYAEYARMSVSEYAAANRIDLASLLKTLNAAAESSELTHPTPPPADAFRRGAALGYTGAYREPRDLDVRDVVTAQTVRGPD
jgi:hypothetical protein